MRIVKYNGMNRHRIAEDLAAGRVAAVSRFDYQIPLGAEADRTYVERARWLDQETQLSMDRERMTDVVEHYNKLHNDVPEAMASVELLRKEESLVVVGGQQAGLFTGPMLVVYKAITILQTARRAEAILQRPVVPVFWIAGEDHDWDEANHTYVLTPQLSVDKVVMPLPESAAGKRTAVSRTRLNPLDWEEPLRRLGEALPDTEFKPGLMSELEHIAAASTTLSEAFAKTMSLLFGKHGLVLIDADDPALRALEGPMFSELIRRNRDVSEALKQGERQVEAADYPLQAAAAEDGMNLFLFRDGERKLLFRDGDDCFDRRGTLRLSVRELDRLATEEPAALSNNALSRPLMQEYVFPVLATVLGPSEIAYWGTLKEAFHTFGWRQPVIVPRQEFTLLEGTVQKQMDKLGLSFEDVWEQWEERRDAWLRSLDEQSLEARFSEMLLNFTSMYRPLVDAAAQINPGLRKLGETNLVKITEQIEFLQTKSLDAMKQQHEAGLRHWERIRLTVQPLGKPQERVYNVFTYINRYGFNWLDEFITQAGIRHEDEAAPHQIVYL